jgi:hypothetical protein
MNESASDLSEIYLTWIGMLAGPSLAFGTYAIMQRIRPSATRPAAVISAAILVVALGAVASSFGFRDVSCNLAFLLIAYVAYSFLAACCLRIPFLSIRILGFVIAAIPIGVGYVMCTIGLLEFVFILGDYTRPPRHIQKMRADLTCRVYSWGYAFSGSGHTVHLYKSWVWLPFLERSVVAISVNETADDDGPHATCADALEKYLR